MTKKIIMSILLLILLVPAIYSLGVSPIRKVVEFEPNKEVDLSIKISNEGQADIKALVYARGDLQENIGIVDSLVIVKGGSQGSARLKVKMPSNFEKPGVHKTDLVVMEYPSGFGTNEETVVSATASVVSELWIRVPYPGKYIEGQLFANSNGIGEEADFVLNIMNFGKEDVGKIKARIKILGSTYEEIAVVETNEISLKSQDQGKLIAKWLADVNPGRYHIVAEVTYDEKKLVLEDDFDVGSLYVGIKELKVRDFSLGQIAVFDILLESKWNEPINNVYGELTVFDIEGSEHTKIKTAAINLKPSGEGEITAYWDTRDVKVGKYNLRILIHYNEKVTERLIETEVNIDSINTNLGLTAQVIAGDGMGRDSILTILVIILVIVNVAWFVFFIRKKK